MSHITHNRKTRIKRRVRAAIKGKRSLPRLSVFRSNRFIYGQVVDDVLAVTVASVNDMKQTEGKNLKKVERAKEAGLRLGKKLAGMKVMQVVFDRGSNKYAGRVKSFCEGVRESGITI